MLDTSKIYASKNHGKFKILNYVNARRVEIKFLKTGFSYHAEAADIRKGDVRDRLHPTIHGVGYLGVGSHKSGKGGVVNKPYYSWKNMLDRCYCQKTQNKHPTYKGCKVDDEWLNFQNFADWFCSTHPDNGKPYELDKDILSGSRVGKLYSKHTCKWVVSKENIEYSQAMTFDFTNPKGEIVTVFNLSKFCKNEGLSQGCMSNVNNGKNKAHNGWTKA